jgi:hypothetical protein
MSSESLAQGVVRPRSSPRFLRRPGHLLGSLRSRCLLKNYKNARRKVHEEKNERRSSGKHQSFRISRLRCRANTILTSPSSGACPAPWIMMISSSGDTPSLSGGCRFVTSSYFCLHRGHQSLTCKIKHRLVLDQSKNQFNQFSQQGSERLIVHRIIHSLNPEQ